MDDATREAVEFLEWLARPSHGLLAHEQDAIHTVLAALDSAAEWAAYWREMADSYKGQIG